MLGDESNHRSSLISQTANITDTLPELLKHSSHLKIKTLKAYPASDIVIFYGDYALMKTKESQPCFHSANRSN